MNIFLIGFMGTGKSTISAALGRRMSREVVEMDELIVKREGMPISEIFEKKGEPYFRELETGLLVELQQKNDVIVSCGGGTPMRGRGEGKRLQLPPDIQHRRTSSHQAFLFVGTEPQKLPGKILAGPGKYCVIIGTYKFT